MKYLFVIDSMGSGGAQNQLSLIAVALKKRGHEVVVFNYFDQSFFRSRLDDAGIPLKLYPKTDKLGIGVIFALRRLIKAFAPDALFSFLDTPNFYSITAKLISRSNVRVVISYRSKTDFKQLSDLQRSLRAWVNRNASAIVANSHHERKGWQERYPAQGGKWKTIYNFVDLEKFKPALVAIPLDSHFICIGQVRPLKNADVLIEALRIMQQRNLPLPIIHWYGKHDFADPVSQQNFERLLGLIEEYELSDQFEWFPPTRNLGKQITRYRALIHPSLLEGLPNAICESLAAGVPVLASSILDHPILIPAGERGYLFDPISPTELIEAFQKIQALTEKEYRQLQKNSRQYAERSLAQETIVNQVIRVLTPEISQ